MRLNYFFSVMFVGFRKNELFSLKGSGSFNAWVVMFLEDIFELPNERLLPKNEE